MKVLVIGLGMIGGSLCSAIKNNFDGTLVLAMEPNESSIQYGLDHRIIDGEVTMEDDIDDIDIIFIASPLKSYEGIFRWISSKKTADNILISDIGSVKEMPEKMAYKYLGSNITFLGGHPMAGSDKSGVEYSSASLFENAVYFLTDVKGKDQNQVRRLKKVIAGIGSEIVETDSETHDLIVSKISHIPHILASLLANSINDGKSINFAGSGFRDTTRIASGNPDLWKDIILNNNINISKSIDSIMDSLKNLKDTIMRKDEESLVYFLKEGKVVRDSIKEHLRDNITPLYDIIIDVKDRPGVLGEVTTLLGKNSVNIKQIEILNSREGYGGALRMYFSSIDDLDRANDLIKRINLN